MISCLIVIVPHGESRGYDMRDAGPERKAKTMAGPSPRVEGKLTGPEIAHQPISKSTWGMRREFASTVALSGSD